MKDLHDEMTILRVLLEEYEKTEPDMLKKRIQAAYRLFEQKISHRGVCSVLGLNRSLFISIGKRSVLLVQGKLKIVS